MEVSYDHRKDASNQAKHGVSLALSVILEWETLLAMPDRRHDYGEPRQIGYLLMGERLYCVVFTDRGTTRRIISLRKANNREKALYAKAFNTQ
jgi:hypothetical protein